MVVLVFAILWLPIAKHVGKYCLLRQCRVSCDSRLMCGLWCVYNCRSTPCCLVKADEEWGELSACEAGDKCGSSHTRTEQQFHPEVLEHFTSRLCVMIFRKSISQELWVANKATITVNLFLCFLNIVYSVLFLSFFFVQRVFSPALRP